MHRFNFLFLVALCLIAINGINGWSFWGSSDTELDEKQMDMEKMDMQVKETDESSNVETETGKDGSKTRSENKKDVKEKKMKGEKLGLKERHQAQSKKFGMTKQDEDCEETKEPEYRLDDPEYRTLPPPDASSDEPCDEEQASSQVPLPSTDEPCDEEEASSPASGVKLLPKRPEAASTEAPLLSTDEPCDEEESGSSSASLPSTEEPCDEENGSSVPPSGEKLLPKRPEAVSTEAPLPSSKAPCDEERKASTLPPSVPSTHAPQNNRYPVRPDGSEALHKKPKYLAAPSSLPPQDPSEAPSTEAPRYQQPQNPPQAPHHSAKYPTKPEVKPVDPVKDDCKTTPQPAPVTGKPCELNGIKKALKKYHLLPKKFDC